MKDAQGGHIVAHSQGGSTLYANLVVISAEHNRRMQDMNANDYKQSVLLEGVA
jgi:5-methylcytosine-specific restriction endonuclease McrA